MFNVNNMAVSRFLWYPIRAPPTGETPQRNKSQTGRRETWMQNKNASRAGACARQPRRFRRATGCLQLITWTSIFQHVFGLKKRVRKSALPRRVMPELGMGLETRSPNLIFCNTLLSFPFLSFLFLSFSFLSFSFVFRGGFCSRLPSPIPSLRKN